MKGACLKTFSWGFFIRDAKALRLVANGKSKIPYLNLGYASVSAVPSNQGRISSPPFEVSTVQNTAPRTIVVVLLLKLCEAHE